MAWRVTLDPAVRPVIDSGPSSHRRRTIRKRVSSPSAAKMGAVELAGARLAGCGKVGLDQCHLDAPTLLVRSKGFRASRQWDCIEDGLGEGEHHSVRDFL